MLFKVILEENIFYEEDARRLTEVLGFNFNIAKNINTVRRENPNTVRGEIKRERINTNIKLMEVDNTKEIWRDFSDMFDFLNLVNSLIGHTITITGENTIIINGNPELQKEESETYTIKNKKEKK